MSERRITPPSVDDPACFSVRSGGVILERDADWIQATDHLRQAFVQHPELGAEIVGNIPGS